MALKPLSRSSIITIAIVIPLCIIGISAFFIIRKVKQILVTSPKQTKYIPMVRTDEQSEDEKSFNQLMIDFYSMADMAQGIMPIDTTLAAREKSLADIENIGLYYWNRNIEILDSVRALKLNDELKHKIDLCEEYCRLNKSCYELMYKAIDEHSRKYDKEIDDYLLKISAKTKEIQQD